LYIKPKHITYISIHEIVFFYRGRQGKITKIILLSDSASFQTPILFFESPGIFGQTLILWHLQSCKET